MALKTSNKSRKKDVNDQITDSVKKEKGAIHSWWWFSNKPKPYLIAAAIVTAIILLA